MKWKYKHNSKGMTKTNMGDLFVQNKFHQVDQENSVASYEKIEIRLESEQLREDWAQKPSPDGCGNMECSSRPNAYGHAVSGNDIQYEGLDFSQSLDQLLAEESLEIANPMGSSLPTGTQDVPVAPNPGNAPASKIYRRSSTASTLCGRNEQEDLSFLKHMNEDIANFVDRLNSSDKNKQEIYESNQRKKRPYFRRSKYSKEIVEEFEARKKIQKRERNRVLAAESRRRQKNRLSTLEEENAQLRMQLENVLKRLVLYEDIHCA